MRPIRAFLAILLILPMTVCPASAADTKRASIERFSVTTGKPLAEGEKPANEAVMTVYHAPKPNGAAALIYPGGGYSVLVTEPEGHRIAKWFNEHGVTGVIVEYRLPAGNSSVPLADANRAMRIVRARAREWDCEPGKIGNIGFSAGGHLASTTATHFDMGDPKASDPIDRQGCRPDFSILIYPVITMGEKTHQGSKDHLLGTTPDEQAIVKFSNEKQITPKTPPTFLAHAVNDTLVVPENSRMYHEALVKNKVPAEYLELPSGGHGLDGYQGPMWEAWKTACLKWLAKGKFIPKADAN